MKKKGFTLVELLAVIVILAIISLIATPMIMGVIEKSKKGAFKSSVNGILSSIEYSTLEDIEKMYYFPNNELEIKGEQPTGGYIKINSDGDSNILVYNNDYCVTKMIGSPNLKVENFKDSSCENYINSLNGIEFDQSTGTITGYDISYGTDIVIPYSINGVVVKEIADSAFLDDNSDKLVVAYDRTSKLCANTANIMLLDQCSYQYKYDYAVENNIEYDYVMKAKSYGENEKICLKTENDEKVVVADNTVLGMSDGYYKCYYTKYNYVFGDITSVDFSNATELEKIGAYAFAYQDIEKVTFNNPKLKEIGYAAFEGNYLSTLDLSSLINLKKINMNAFAVNEIKNLIIENPSLEIISAQVFGYNSLEEVDLSSETNLKEIGYGIFMNNNLKSVNLGISKDLKIGYYALAKMSIYRSNVSLNSIINRTGNAYDWITITSPGNGRSEPFETGTITHPDGDIIVTK